MRRLLPLMMLMLLLPLMAHAQKWTGSIDGNGSYNFRQSNAQQLKAGAKVEFPRWWISADGAFSRSFMPYETEKSNILAVIDEADEALFMTMEVTESAPLVIRGNANVNYSARIGKAGLLQGGVQYVRSRKEESPERAAAVIIGESIIPGVQLDEIRSNVHDVVSITRYEHALDGGATLVLVANAEFRVSADSLHRFLDGEYYRRFRDFTTKAELKDIIFTLDARYENGNLFGVKNLKSSLGVKINHATDVDSYSALNFHPSEDRYVDSTEFNQNFRYAALNIEPYADLEYTAGKVSMYVREHFLGYRQQLEVLRYALPGDPGGFSSWDPRNRISAGMAYMPSQGHRIGFDFFHDIVRPEYKMLSPVVLHGDSEGEYITGDPGLKPENNNIVQLQYAYSYKDAAGASVTARYTDSRNKAEKVLKEDMSGRSNVFTWMNSKWQQNMSAIFEAHGKWRFLSASAMAKLNYNVFHYLKTASGTDFNYELSGKLQANLPLDFMIKTDVGYMSQKKLAFGKRDYHVPVNLHVEKLFPKAGILVYIEGTDLFDKPMVEYTWNETFDQFKINESTWNRRLLLLGLKYSF